MDSMESSGRLVPYRYKKARMAKAKSGPSFTIDGRHKVLHNYHDHSLVPFTSDAETDLQVGSDGDKRKGPRGGVTVPFPTKLHVMLTKVEDEGLSHIVSWQPHGRCFVVHKPKEFVSEVMPSYFRQSKLTSFQRQLNLYGFSRITTGRDRGGYYHERFLKHKLFLCRNMSRIRIKGTGIKGKASPETEPDFYTMTWVVLEDTSEDLARELEDEVAAAMEEENKQSEPVKRARSKRQHRIIKNKRDGARKSPTNGTLLDADLSCSSPRSTPVVIAPPALVTPGTAYAKNLHPVSMQNMANLYPPLLSSDSEDASYEKEPHSGDEIAFEGKHFHYLDSFAAPAPAHGFALEPRKKFHSRAATIQLVPSLPSLTESSFSVAQSLREPIMTPSSSSSSLCETFRQEESLDINPDTIFSEKGFDGDWEIGGVDVDIDAEYTLLEG